MKKKYIVSGSLCVNSLKRLSALIIILFFVTANLKAQFNTPTVDGTITAGEYGTHTNGVNQQTQGAQVWYMTWDNTNLYVGVSNANTAEGTVMYFDTDVLAPINSGVNANGTLIGQAYDNTNFANLPFRADLVLYVNNGYREFRTRNLTNGWTTATTAFGTYAETGGNVREFSIPWSSFPIGSRPAGFAWFGYVTSTAGNAYTTMPIANPTGTTGLTARWERYFKVDGTNNGSSIAPFSRDSYVFNAIANNNSFGVITVWDFTMNTAGFQISRGTTGGNWTINGTLLVNAGSIFFGPLGGPFGSTNINNITVNSGSVLDMDFTTQPINASGNFFSSGTFRMSQAIGGDLNLLGNFTHQAGVFDAFATRARALNINGTAAQTITPLTTGTTISFLNINNTTLAGVTLTNGAASSLTVNSQFNVAAGATFNIGTNATIALATTSTGVLPATSIINHNGNGFTINCTTPYNILGTLNRNIASTTVSSTAATLTFGANSIYNHNANGTTPPTATWNATSNCNIIGLVNNNLSLFAGTFGNITWNNPSQTSSGNISGALIAQGNLTVTAGTLNLNGQTLTVGRDVTNNATINSTTAASTLALNGTLAQIISGAGVWTTGTVGRLMNLTINNTSGANPAVNLNTNLALQSGITLTNGILGGTGNLTLGIGAAGTFASTRTNGSIATVALTTAYNLGLMTVNVVYNSASALITTGLELPTTAINGLTINSANHVALDKAVSILTNLTLTTGQLRLGTFNLDHTNAATLTGGSTTSYVAADGSGQFLRTFAAGASAAFNFPVGDVTAAEYTPVSLTLTANSIIRTIGVRVTDGQHPNDVTASNFVSRYWSFTNNAAGTYTYTAAFTHLNTAADINGSGFNINRWTGSVWSPLVSTGGPAPPLTLTGFTETSAPLNGSDFTARINAPNTYTWNATSGAGDWNTPSNWTPARFAPFSSDVLQFTNGGTPTAFNIPIQTIGRLIVDNNTNVVFQTNAANTLTLGFAGSTNVLNVTAGSNLQLGSVGANVLTLAFSTTVGINTSIAGNITINPNTSLNNALVFTNLLAANNIITGSIVNNGGVITAVVGTTTFGAGSFYVHNRDGGAIPTPTWNATSTLQVTGTTITNPTGFSGTFGNVIWNCPGQSSTGAFAGVSTIAGNLTVTAGTVNFASVTISVQGNVINNGTINTSGAGSLLNLNGTTLQNISGTGIWTTGVNGRLLNLTLNNTAGANLNSNLAIQTALVLNNGVLSGTGTLTLGVPATAITVTRTLGSISATTAYNFTTGVYTLNYNGGNTITAGAELPSAANPTNGIVTVSVANTNVTMAANANIGRITTSLATNTFNISTFTLGLSDATPVSNAGVLTLNGVGATLNFNGTVAQTFTLAATYTGSLISNFVVNNTNVVSGLSLGTNNINVGAVIVNFGAQLSFASLNLNVRGDFVNNGLVNSAAGSILTMNGTSLQTINGTGVWTTGVTARLQSLVVNNAAGVNLEKSLTLQTGLTLTAGTLNTTNASVLTFGIGATSTLTTLVTSGTLAMPAAFNLAGVTYNITYNTGTAVNTGTELPPLSVTNYNLGVLTVANANGLALSADANIASLTINGGITFNLNSRTLGIYVAYTNSGILNGNAAGSTLNFNGIVAQSFSPGTLTGGALSNLVSSNTHVSGVAIAANLTVGNVSLNASSFLFVNGSVTLNVRNNITNAGNFNTSLASASVVMNGTAPQIISGTGTWTAGANGLIQALTINNANGVDLQCNLGVQNTLTLTAGDLGSTNASVFTLGGGFTSTLNMTRSAGSLSATTAYNLAGVTFNAIYGTGAPTITVGNELPSLPEIITGTFQVNNANGVILTKNIQVNGTWTFTSGNFTIGANSITLNSTITNTSGNFIGGATSNITFSGAGATTTLGIITNGLQDLTINRSGITITLIAASPLTIANNLNMTAGILAVNSNSLTINGGFTGAGLGTVTGTGSLVFGGTSGGNMGTLYLTGGAQTFVAFTMNRTGAGASATIVGDLSIATLTLTNGVVNMNNSRVIYSGNAAAMTANPGSEAAYFSFLGGNSGFQWNMSSIGSGTYRWPVGPAGVVAGFRPVSIQTSGTTTSNVRIGFINHTGGGVVSGTNVIDDISNQRVNFITNITASAALTTPNLTLTYQGADFNNAPPGGVSAVRPWRNNGTAWIDLAPQTGNAGPVDNNTEISKNTVTIGVGSNPYILAENISPASSANTYTWIGATSTAWATITNWSPNSPAGGPGATDNAIINNGALANQPLITTAVTIGNLTLSDGSLTLTNPGTLTVNGAFINTATLNCNATTTVSFVSASSQTIPIGNYNNLTSTSTGARVLSPTGNINISGTFTPGTNTYTTAGSTVNFTAAASTIPAFTYNNLTVSSATSGTMAGAVTVSGNLFLNTPIFNDNGFQITGNATGTLNTALTTTLNIGTVASATQFPTNFTNANITLPIGSTTVYNSNAAQIISGVPLYGNLTLAATAAVAKTLAGNASLAGNLTINLNNTLFDNNFTLTARGNVINNGAHSVSATGEILLASGTSIHNLSGTGIYGNLELNDGQGATITSAITVSGDLTVNTGVFTIPGFAFTQTAARTTTVNSTLVVSSATGAKAFGNLTVANTGTWNNTGSSPIAIAGNFVNNGLFTASGGIYSLTGTTRTFTGIGALTIPNITCSGTYTSSHPALTVNTALSVGGSFTNSGILNIPTGVISGAGVYINGANGILNYTSATTPTVTTFTANATPNLVVYNNVASAQTVRNPTLGQYYNLTINKPSSIATLAAATTILNNLTITAGTLADGAFLLTGAGAFGTLDMSAANTTLLNLTNITTNPFPTFLNNNFHPTLSTVNVCIGTAAQNIRGLNYGNLNILGTVGIRTFTGAATINGNFSTTALPLADGGFTHNILGNITHAATHTGAGRFVLSGTAPQTMTGAGSYTNIEFNNATGVSMLSSITINGTPRLTSGNLSIGSNTLTLNGAAFIQTTGNLSTTILSNLTYSGTGVSHFIPNGVANLGLLTLALPTAGNGVTLNSNVQLNAATGLTLTNGRVVLGAFNLTLSSVSAISGTLNVNNMVVADGTGQLMKTFPAAVNPIFTFPVGDATVTAEYSPVALTLTSNSLQRTIGVRVTDAVHPSNGVNPHRISRYWSFTDSELGNGTYTYAPLTFTSINSLADNDGTVANYRLNRFTSSTWFQYNSAVPPTFSTTSTLNETNGTLGGSDWTLRFNGATTYTWIAPSASNWNTASNWSPARIVPGFNDILIFNDAVTSTPTANNVPTQSIAQLNILGATTVASLQTVGASTLSLGATASSNALTIAAGAELVIDASGINSLTLAFTGALANLSTAIAGQITINENFSGNNTLSFTNLLTANNTITGIIRNNGGTFTTTAATTGFGSGAIYRHNFVSNLTSNLIPTATWNANSTVQITNANFAPTSGLNQTFGNLTINTTAALTTTLHGTVTLPGTLTLTQGTLAIGANILNLNGPAIVQTAGLLNGITTSTLVFGPGVGNANAGLFIPTSLTTLGNLTLNIATTNSVNLNAGLSLNAGTGLTLTGGRLVLGSNHLTFQIGSSQSGGSINSFVAADGTGEVKRTFAAGATAAFVFPIGDVDATADYSPYTITFSANSTPRTIGVRVVDAVHPDNGASVHYATRYWIFSDSQVGVGTYAYSTSGFTYSTNSPSDVFGTPANYRINRWDGTNWSQLNTSGTGPSYTTSTSNDHVSGTLGGNEFALRLNPPRTYTWIGTNGTGGSGLTGDFQTPTNWSPSRFSPQTNDVLQFTLTGTPTANNVPLSQTIGRLLVDNNTNVQLQSANPASALNLGDALGATNVLNITAGSNLQISSTGANQLSINFPLAASTTTIAGTITINANAAFTNALVFTNLVAANNIITGTIDNNGGIVTATTTTTNMGATAVYRHDRDGGAILAPTWNAASLCQVNGIVATAPTGMTAQTFGRFTWDCPSQTVAANLLMTSGTFAGDFSMVNTNTGSFSFHSGIASTIQMNGDLIIQGGTLNLNNSGAVVTTLNLAGNYNQSGGVFQRGAATVNQAFNFNNTVNRTFTQTAGTFNTTGIAVTVNLNALLTLNSDFNNVQSFLNNGTLTCGSSLISGAGTFTLTNLTTATISLNDAGGISTSGATGNIRVLGARSYGATANYIFNGACTSTGNGFVAANNVTFNNATISLAAAVAISGGSNCLTLNNSLVNLGNFNLRLATTTNTISGTPSVTNMLVTNGTGVFSKNLPATPATYTFPVGTFDGTDYEYSPASINFTALATGELGVNVQPTVHPSWNVPANPIDYLERRWTWSVISGLATYTIPTNGFTLNYVDNDVINTEANLGFSSWNGSNWTGYLTTLNDPANTIAAPSAGTFTNATFPINNQVFTGRNTPISYHYRTVANGNWHTPATWEISTDVAFTNPLPVPSVTFPTDANSLSITIRSGHQIAVSADVSADQLTIDNTSVPTNSRLTINAGINFTITDGAGNDFTLNGNSRLDVNGTLINNGVISGASTINTNFLATGTYEHAQNGGVIPTVTWTAGSLCLVTGTTTTAPTGTVQNFSNFTWNATNQGNISSSLAWSGTTIGQNVRIQSTGSGTGLVAFNTSAVSFIVNGDLIIEGGTLSMNTAAATSTLTLAGNYNQTGGTLTSSSTAQAINFSGVNRTYSQSAGVVNAQINYTVNLGASLTLNNNIVLQNTRSFTNNGTLVMGTQVVSGSTGTVFNNSSVATTTLSLGAAEGITTAALGNVQTATRTYGALANYIYTSTALNSGNGFVAGTSLNLIGATINLSASATLSGTTGALQLNGSVLSLGTNNLTLSSGTSTITGAALSATNMIRTESTGQFFRQIPTSAWVNPYVFPIGDNGIYSPVSLSFTANTAAGTIGIRTIDAVHPSMGAVSDYLNRYWRTTIAGITAYTLSSAVFSYDDALVTGSEANLNLSAFTGSVWSGMPGITNTVANTISVPVSGTITQLDFPLNGFDYTGRNTATVYYRTVNSGNWSNPAIWETSSNVTFTPASAASVAPDAENSVSILVRNGHVVQITANTDADQLTIDNTLNSTINVNSGINFTLLDGLGNELTLNTNSRLLINGTLVNRGQISGSNATTTIVNNAGVYQHDADGGSIPTATWNAGSFNRITGTILTAPTNFAQTFHHVDWNCPAQNAIVALTSTNI